jgi:hypothetical protein
MQGISWRMRLLVYNVRKLITVASAIKLLTLASHAIMVTIYHQPLAALHVLLSRHNVHSAAMHRLAHPAIPVINWPTPPLVSKVLSLLTALITRKVRRLVLSAIQVTFYLHPPPAQAARLLLHIVPSAVLLILVFDVLVATIYQVQLLVFSVLP